MTTKPYTRRERVVALLLALAAILVAGVVVRAANLVAAGDAYIFTTVQVGESARIGEDATLVITKVELGGIWREDEALHAASGRFILVQYEMAAGVDSGPSIRQEVWWGVTRYRPVADQYEQTPPGFTSTRSALFEVPAEALDGLVFIIGESEFIYSHEHWLRLPLTWSAAERAATDATVEMSDSTVRVTR